MINYPTQYLGDGVYADFDGHQIQLTTQEGMCIYLESSACHALVDYRTMIATMNKELAAEKAKHAPLADATEAVGEQP